MAFSDKMLEMMNKGLSASRSLAAKAASQAQVWGEMGVLRVEILQLRAQAQRLTGQLGARVYAAFAERGETSLSLESGPLGELVGRIRDLSLLLQEKEAAYRKMGGKESDLDETEKD